MLFKIICSEGQQMELSGRTKKVLQVSCKWDSLAKAEKFSFRSIANGTLAAPKHFSCR
jgi:hypothetical protein